MNCDAAPRSGNTLTCGLTHMENVERADGITIEPVVQSALLEPIWCDLQSRSEASFFLSWDWIGTWLRVLGKDAYVVKRHHAGKVVALGLISQAKIKRGLLRLDGLFLTETGDPQRDRVYTEYNGFLIAREAPGDTAERCLKAIADAGRSRGTLAGWQQLRVSGVMPSLIEAASRAGLWAHVRERQQCMMVDLRAVRAVGRPYIQVLGPRTREQIRRSIRFYEARGPLRVLAPRDLQEAQLFFTELKTLNQHRWGDKGAFSSPYFEPFHRQVIATCWPRETVELLRIVSGETTIGYFYNFLFQGWVGFYMDGLAYEADTRARPGMVSFVLIIERHLARGAEAFDFMAGDDPYKRHLGQPKGELIWAEIQRPSPRIVAHYALRTVRRAWRGARASLQTLAPVRRRLGATTDG
jgi:CelD/BcsL family acetyltransferase involved in cellulose biosynthesis